MRYNYISRYWSKYGEGGFKRLVNEGFLCKNTYYNYVPTYTGPGHAAIYTGATPAVNGIVGNDWYDRKSGKMIYCAADTTVTTVGSNSVKVGKMSPANLLSNTVTDELRKSSAKRSKVIGIALKDRGAILPAGRLANAAYWFDGASGNWVSSTYYSKALPEWLIKFNEKKLAAAYLSQPWNTLLPIENYTESTADDVLFEGAFPGELKPVFPHDLPKLKKESFDLIRGTPFGNNLTKDLAMAAITGEKLGAGEYTDFLCVSFSSTDYVGHQFGTNSIETEDTYLRLDKDLESLLNFLDQARGKANVLVFLTSDHGAAENVKYMQQQNLPAGNFSPENMIDSVNHYLSHLYGKGNWAITINQQIYLKDSIITAKALDLLTIKKKVIGFVKGMEGVADVILASDLNKSDKGTREMIRNGYYPKRSGDIIVNLKPGWIDWGGTGTSHGSPYEYDTHVPLLWYGWKIKNGSSEDTVRITDITATLSQLLSIPPPKGCMGVPVPGLLK
jgi:predicted AlkP superfamily pyrophosphatase or phosphodiesterase